MIDDILFKGLKHESLFRDVPINALDCGLYTFNRNGVTYIMERHEEKENIPIIKLVNTLCPKEADSRGVQVYYNIVASVRDKKKYDEYKKDNEEKKRLFE